MMVGRGSASGATSFACDLFNWRGKAIMKRSAEGGGQGDASAKLQEGDRGRRRAVARSEDYISVAPDTLRRHRR